ncbi:MAG TPA: glycine C-acetyltransferase [Myxococcota bacterium]|nr:glycine C-acetyltransferase [Myxococcota bacterium]HRY94636.1 glycine C-acetyltransferase [Myxococcota bacterium]HSA21660.1 glycine C-acetyltransferase [Myxococcota bacterium]
MFGKVKEQLLAELKEIQDAGLTKEEWPILTPQGAHIQVSGGREVLNFCANNYLGLSSHPEVLAAARRALETHGYGMSSVRFICGTQDIHKQLEKKVAEFLETEDTILYSSCFDANGGLFETLFGPDDVIISDALNHASIIDGVRLSKAERLRYANADMAELEAHLKASQGKRRRVIATDGVFSMDGIIAPLDKVCDLADRYDALVMVDDSHATGFMGKRGRGAVEHCGVLGRVDIITSTLGKALGGASGGFTTGRKEIIALLRQRSRPYLFSNTLAPVITATTLKVLELLSATTALRDKLEASTRFFREKMTAAGFAIKPGVHPIVPLMLGEARLAADMARDMLAEGIYVVGFSYPVVPKGAARIRVQISAAHEREHLERAIAAFVKVGRKHGVLKG